MIFGLCILANKGQYLANFKVTPHFGIGGTFPKVFRPFTRIFVTLKSAREAYQHYLPKIANYLGCCRVMSLRRPLTASNGLKYP